MKSTNSFAQLFNLDSFRILLSELNVADGADSGGGTPSEGRSIAVENVGTGPGRSSPGRAGDSAKTKESRLGGLTKENSLRSASEMWTGVSTRSTSCKGAEGKKSP